MLNLISSNWKYITSGYVADIKDLFRCWCKPASNFYRTLIPNCYLQRLKSFNILMIPYKNVAPYWEIIRNYETLILIFDRQNILMTFSRFFPPFYTEILKFLKYNNFSFINTSPHSAHIISVVKNSLLKYANESGNNSSPLL